MYSGQTPMAQDKELLSRYKEQEEELMRLRRQHAEAAIKDLELLKEMHVLERRYASMRRDLDRQQNDLISNAAETIDSRADQLDQNIRLSLDLLEAETERSIFVSSLLRLLADYDVHPFMMNASTIARHTKLLVQTLRRQDTTSMASGYAYQNQGPNQPEMLPSKIGQSTASTSPEFKFPVVSISHDASPCNFNSYEYGPGSVFSKIARFPDQSIRDDPNGLMEERHLPIEGGVGHFKKQVPMQENTEITFSGWNKDGITRKQTSEPRIEVSYLSPSTSDNLLGSSLPEELQPGIEDFQIVGEAKIGCIIQACGIPTNGTAVCMFQWVYFEDGPPIDVPDATYPDYLVTANDLDQVIAVQCIPVDGDGQQGEMVMAFANNKTRISLDQEMEEELKSYITAGKAIFNVFLLKKSSEVGEPVTLIIERYGYKIRLNNLKSIIEESYSDLLSIEIYTLDRRNCTLRSSNGSEFLLSTNMDVRLRDTLVLTFRFFQNQAIRGETSSQFSYPPLV